MVIRERAIRISWRAVFNTASGSWVGAVATVPVSEATVTGVKSFMAG